MSDLFPADFVFGAATSAYQIEGATDEDGRGPSIWDTFCRTPGKVKGGDTGDVACDHYHRYLDDVALLTELGVGAYRFSVAWPRIFPTGREKTPLAAGLAFYDRLVDALLGRGIEPWLTLYHWDLPQALQDGGGWANRDTALRFVDYADTVARALGDRVKRWITHNEPWCVAMMGHWTGDHAPGHHDPSEALRVAHHVLLSHGLAMPVLRAEVPDGRHGITLNFTPGVPASPSDADRREAHRFDGYFNRWFLDPVAGRGYPADQLAFYVEHGLISAAPDWLQAGDLDVIGAPIDLLGVNYYTRAILRGGEEGNEPRTIHDPPASGRTDIGWEVYPDGLYDLLVRLQQEVGPVPLVITENGAAYNAGPDSQGTVADADRTAYLRGHLLACARARAAGVDLGGYFAWSLLDNFEWAEGYGQRFGLVYTDYGTQRRIIKDSGRWFAQVARTRRVE